MNVEDFLTAQEEQEVIDAIRIAERQTSGEIRVHIESHHTISLEDRAQQVFHYLKMDNTSSRNGVLIYIAVQDHAFHVMGDLGIHEKVPVDFWNTIKEQMQVDFGTSAFAKGLIWAIEMIGLKLAEYFPWIHTDSNELPDTISKG